MSWNRNARRGIVAQQVEAVEALYADVVCLQETTEASIRDLRDGLASRFPHIVESFADAPAWSRVGARRYGVLIASRYPLSLGATTVAVPWPERILSTVLSLPTGRLLVTTAHIPPGSSNGWVKVEMLEALAAVVAARTHLAGILCGDFNTPQAEIASGEVVTWAQRLTPKGPRLRERFRGGLGARWDAAERVVLTGTGLLDAFRTLHDYEREDFSWWVVRNGCRVGRRFDHAFCAPEVQVHSCGYVHEVREQGLSDHAALELVFSLLIETSATRALESSSCSEDRTRLLYVGMSAPKLHGPSHVMMNSRNDRQRERPTSFFGTLGALAGSRRENQFSRAFLACFQHSASFRLGMVRLLHNVCRVPVPTISSDEWACAVEVPTPWGAGGRPDIRIRYCGRSRNKQRTFYLESKLGAPLTREQLGRYRRHGIQHLIAVTKNRPEVSKKTLAADGIYTMHWQDVHRELQTRRANTAADRFVASAMITYLEELGMAYREDITVGDLQRCRRVLNAIAARKKELSPKNAFEVADACLSFLDDVRRDLIDHHPALEERSRWGPGYVSWAGNGHRYHGFGWDLYRGHWNKDVFGCRIWLPERERRAILWDVHQWGSSVGRDRVQERQLKEIAPKGILDQSKLLDILTAYAKRWRVV